MCGLRNEGRDGIVWHLGTFFRTSPRVALPLSDRKRTHHSAPERTGLDGLGDICLLRLPGRLSQGRARIADALEEARRLQLPEDSSLSF